jgi:hypothetical protein
MTAELVEIKKSKDRSPTFPFITLERALERARQFYAEEKRGIAPYSRVVLHWNYSESSSGGLQTAAALKNYGLITEPAVMGAKGRNLQLTDLALRILLDQRPDSTERDAFIRDAAFKPAVAAEVYGKWDESLPQDATLNHFLMLEKKFTEETAAKVTKILKENHAFAKIGSAALESERQDKKEDLDMIGQQQGESVPTTNLAGVAHALPKTIAALAAKSSSHTEQHVLRSGITVTIHMSGQPTANTYFALERLMKFKGDDYSEQEAPPGEQ